MSLSETVVEKVECPKCGAAVRPDSQFCYNCGGKVVDEVNSATVSTNNSAAADSVDEKKPAPGLRSAREIKRRERTFQRRTREVVWEPVVSTPDTQLIVITAVVILFTIVVIILAFYLR